MARDFPTSAEWALDFPAGRWALGPAGRCVDVRLSLLLMSKHAPSHLPTCRRAWDWLPRAVYPWLTRASSALNAQKLDSNYLF